MSKYIYIAQVSITPEKEKEFNELYDSEHLPFVLEVPGVLSGRRLKLEWADTPDMPQYLAIYELEDPGHLPKSRHGRPLPTRARGGRPSARTLTVRRHGMFRRMDE